MVITVIKKKRKKEIWRLWVHCERNMTENDKTFKKMIQILYRTQWTKKCSVCDKCVSEWKYEEGCKYNIIEGNNSNSCVYTFSKQHRWMYGMQSEMNGMMRQIF